MDHVKIQCRSSSLKNVSGIQGTELFIHLRVCPRETGIIGKPLQEKQQLAGTIPLPWPLSINTQTTCRNQPSNDIHYLTSLYQAPPPHASADPPFPVTLASVLWGAVGPLPQKTCKNLANTMSPDQHALRASVLVVAVAVVTDTTVVPMEAPVAPC